MFTHSNDDITERMLLTGLGDDRRVSTYVERSREYNHHVQTKSRLPELLGDIHCLFFFVTFRMK